MGAPRRAAVAAPAVSVIVPAHNEERTLHRALDAVLAQTLGHWEAIVVDDGSTDGTARVAATYAERDPRIRVVRQEQRGLSGARNAGLRVARGEWVLLLDADDWIEPTMLERMLDALAADPSLDAVHCGSMRATEGGVPILEEHCDATGDIFALAGRASPFCVHACVWRRALVDRTGTFDESLRRLEDWDFWMRMARSGARFGAVRDVLVTYVFRHGSLSFNARRMLADGLTVLRRGHAADSRVRDAVHARGLPARDLPSRMLALACWMAGYVIAAGGDASALLDEVGDVDDPLIDPWIIAETLFTSVPLGGGQPRSAWPEMWPGVEPQLAAFLLALEAKARARLLARRVRVQLERRILAACPAALPRTLGLTHGTCVETTAPLRDIVPPPGVERVHCRVEIEGSSLGTLDLPVLDGVVSSAVLADAIASAFAWPILERYLSRTIYPTLDVKRADGRASVWRGDVQLLADAMQDANGRVLDLHDRAGWTVFLQELWGEPHFAESRFYDGAEEPAHAGTVSALHVTRVEVSEPLAPIAAPEGIAEIEVTVGGVPLARFGMRTEAGGIAAERLRAPVTLACGLELCRAAVREALLGRPLDDATSLRARLSAAAADRRARGAETAPRRVPVISWPDAPKSPTVTLRRGGPWRRLTRLLRPAPPPPATAGDRLPILMYHRVSPTGSERLSPYRVTPRAFEDQCRFLRDLGFRSATLDEWRVARERRQPLPGRCVVFTFDDGYVDFGEHAWPVLARYGFTAIVFIVAERVGGSNRWDHVLGEQLPLLGWDDIRALRLAGVEFGAHTATHPPMTGLPPEEVLRETARSRAILTEQLGSAPSAFAYPYGDTDAVVQHFVGACGFDYGVTTRQARAAFRDSLLALPRVEVMGSDTLHDFARRLEI